MPQRFKSVTPMLKTEDMRKTVDFYRDVLGFSVDTLWPEEAPTICFLDRGDVHLSFYVDTEPRESAPAMTGQLMIDVDDVTALHASVSAEVEVLWEPEVYHYGRREFAIRDCNGYILSFSEPTSDPPTC